MTPTEPDTSTYYDGIAEGYDTLHGEEQQKKLDLIKNHMTITPHTRILDIGCGSGISSSFDCFCTGIDPSAKLIAIAKKRDTDARHKFYVGKAEDLNQLHFKDQTFDYAIALTSLHHFAEPDTLAYIKRLAKQFVFTVLKKIPQKEKIINTVTTHFTITKRIEEEKDIILFCR